MLKEERIRPGIMLEDKIKLKYVDLKCKQNPDQVTHAFEVYNFPLDQALEICITNKNYFGTAFIKFRLGKMEQAIDEYLKVRSEDKPNN